ncbi:hypothetical protein BGZ88_012125 [Linnemannia elongata]|nr:hypothetical protein BGZ88_012125 [Linnemannia elongata]
MRLSPPSTTIRDILSPSMISLPYHHPTKALLNQPIVPVAQLSMEFAAYRSVTFDRLSSPEAPSPVSDQGIFDMTTDDETASGRYSPLLLSDTMHLDNSIINNHKNDMITVEQLNISGSVSTSAIAAKKRRERNPSKSGHKKPKQPPVKLPCLFPGCATTCSSQPSLARHAEAHKWRGLYAPVRCEACKSALSNEFSVQRHIVRSQPNSRCHRLRVYSIMKSVTEIETSVRFYPKRAHGKKTVEIDLKYARSRYLGDSPL